MNELSDLAKQAVINELNRAELNCVPYDHQRAMQEMSGHCDFETASEWISEWEVEFDV